MPKDHFRTRGFIEGGVIQNREDISVNISALPPFLRTLLVADGTVTKSLEAFFWEKVNVETIAQNDHKLAQKIEWIDANVGDHVLKREVKLCGESSGETYAYATSYLQLETLDTEVKDSLLSGKIGIGELLREIGLETYREVIDIGKEIGKEDEVIYRTYVIHIGGNPIIQITEHFPLGCYQAQE